MHQALAVHAMAVRKADPVALDGAESFLATFKTEHRDGMTLEDEAAVRREAANYIDRFYNPERLHSTLDYVSPVMHELLASTEEHAALSTCPPNGVKIAR
jgi:hypothetical protein